MSGRDDLLATLLAERYGTGEWFTNTPRTRTNEPDDSELTTARRRRELLAAVDTRDKRTA